MSCCTKRANKTEKRLRRNAIYPLSKDIPIREYVEKINLVLVINVSNILLSDNCADLETLPKLFIIIILLD